LKDPPLLEYVSKNLEPAVLVTYDNKMAIEHRELLDRFCTTLAVIDKDARPVDLTPEEYWREVIHRHAHRFVQQDAGSRWRYQVRQRTRIV
jgi:hypothetical protein